MARVRYKNLQELSVPIYLKYKRTSMTDTQIALLYDVSLQTLLQWKKENGLTGKTNIRNWVTWEMWFPEDLEKIKRDFLKYYNMNLNHEYIAEKLNMTRWQLTTFKDRYFPEMMVRKNTKILTDEQKEIARKNGLRLNTVNKRIHEQGMSVEEAITKPLQKRRKKQ